MQKVPPNITNNGPVEPSVTRSSFNKVKVLQEAFIVKLRVEKAIKVNNHYEFILRVFGRSRFCSYLPTAKYNSYTCKTRYRKLKALHNKIKEELMRYPEYEMYSMPEFPKDSWFDSKKEAAEKRIKLFNEYFDSLILNFAKAITFSETLTNFCSAFPIEILILSINKEEMNRYLNATMKRLFNGMEDFKSIISEATAASSINNHDSTFMNSNTQSILLNTNIEKPHNSLWKRCTPFDYVSNDHLFRIDIINSHFSSKTPISTLLSHTANVFILIDVGLENWLKEFEGQLNAIKKNNKTSVINISFVIGVIVNVENAEKDYSSKIEKIVGDSFKDKSTSFFCRECSLITGGGVLETFDDLLKHYK